VYSKFYLAFFFIIASSLVFCSNDLLSKRILRYNKIDEQKVKVDSNKVFYNLKFLNSKEGYDFNVEIIKSRKKLAGNFSFFVLLASLFGFAFIRYRAGSSYLQLFSSFFSLKTKDGNQISLFKNILITTAFISLFTYLVYLIIQSRINFIESKSLLVIIFYSVILILIYKYIVFHWVQYIFNLKGKITGVQFIVFDLMYIFVFISLPLLFLESLLTVNLRNTLLASVLGYFIFLNAFMYYKIFIINSHLLTRHVFKMTIYFYVVEIIPILLFLKYLKLL
jgi:hypothetical protein